MGKSVCLILGSCLALQAPSLLSELNFDSRDLGSNAELSEQMPLFHEEHSRELIDGGVNEGVKPEAMARFVLKKTRELLPVPFKGRSQKIARALIETANEYQMDPLFLMAVIEQESKFDPTALGSHGEIGLMQLKPSTALNFAGDIDPQAIASVLADPVQNIRLGAAYMSQLRASFHNRSTLYISAYNMGAARLRMNVAAGVNPSTYQTAVLAHYVELAGGVPQTIAMVRAEIPVLNRTLAL